jgi:predicted ribosome quality control (RQC) complex YloA/Tae2 family protein
MRILLDTTKSLEQNAEHFYNRAKKNKKKIEGAKAALEKSYERLEKAKEEVAAEEQLIKKKEDIKKEWYEKFRWFVSSEGFLCIGGRDSTSNEIVVKKHMDKDDIVFHTENPGSPFFIIKSEGKKPGEKTINECAVATASYSKAWKVGVSFAEVFYVNPEQVTKEAKAGEFIAKGAFMIYGKKNHMNASLKLAVGIKDNKIIAGPLDSVKTHAEKYVTLVQGDEKTSDIAKKIKQKLGAGELDDIIRMLPTGGCKIVK